MIDTIDFCIKTHLRPVALERLQSSILRFYPDAKITVSHHKCIAAGRNEMVDATERPYLLFLDDDFLFTAETRIESLMAEMSKADIVAGLVCDVSYGERTLRNSGGNITMKGASLHLDKAEPGFVDVVPNFFLARREVFKFCRWRFGIGAEHTDFFMQAKRDRLRVFQTDKVIIDHDLQAPCLPGYKAARWNVGENILRFLEHWDLERVVVNGRVVHSRPREGMTATCLMEAMKCRT